MILMDGVSTDNLTEDSRTKIDVAELYGRTHLNKYPLTYSTML